MLASSLALPREELSLSLLSLLSLLELEAAGGGEWRPTVPWALCTGGISSLIASERLAFSASLSLTLLSDLCEYSLHRGYAGAATNLFGRKEKEFIPTESLIGAHSSAALKSY